MDELGSFGEHVRAAGLLPSPLIKPSLVPERLREKQRGCVGVLPLADLLLAPCGGGSFCHITETGGFQEATATSDLKKMNRPYPIVACPFA